MRDKGTETGKVSPHIIAHRGYSARAPENTLAALRAAVDAGADGIEWDMSTAACGTPVLFHDTSLGRTTNGVGPLRRRTLAQLQALDAGTWFDPEFAGEPIPSLAEACDFLTELRYPGTLVAEIKGWRELEDVDRMVDTLTDRGWADRTLLIAIDWTTLDRVARTRPEMPLGFIVEKEERFDEGLARAADLDGAGLAVDWRILLADSARIHAARDAGVSVGVWTVNEVEVAARLHGIGVRDLTTNEVEALLDWKAGL